MTFQSASQPYLNLKALHASHSFEAGLNGAIQHMIVAGVMPDPKGHHRLD
jgi:hypothetical protein